MPTVRRYEKQIVSTNPLPSARVRGKAPQIDLSEGINQVQRAAFQIAQEEKRKADQVALLAADRQLSQFEAGLSHQDGALTRKGKDAFGLPEEVMQDFNQLTASIEKNLTNDTQREAFKRAAQARRWDINSRIQRHVAGERQRYDTTESESYIENERIAAVTDYHNPERITVSIARQAAAYQDFAARNGMPASWTKQQIEEATSKTHTAVIIRMLANGEDLLAQNYYNKNKEGLQGDDAAQIESRLQVATTEGGGLRGAGQIWQELGPKTDTDPVHLDRLRDEAEKRFGENPKIYRAVIQNIRERANLRNSAIQERAEANQAAVWQAVNQGMSIENVTRMPEYQSLPGYVQNKIKSSILSQKEDVNWATYWEKTDPVVLSRMSEAQILNLTSELGIELVNRLMKEKRSLTVRDATIDTDLFKTLAHEAGLKPYDTTLNEKEKARLGQLKNHVESIIAAEQRATGRKLSRERKTQIMQEVIDKRVMIDRFWWDKERIVATLTPKERENAYVPIEKISPVFIAQAIVWLKETGIVPTEAIDEAVVELKRGVIQKAYAARISGATRMEIEAILRGK